MLLYSGFDMKKSKRQKKAQHALTEGTAETIGQRLARLRGERGFTQVEFGELTGVRQSHLSDLERGRLQINADMAARFATALGVTTDELLGLQPRKANGRIPRRLLRRVEKIADLPLAEQKALLKTIDAVVDRHRLRSGSGR